MPRWFVSSLIIAAILVVVPIMVSAQSPDPIPRMTKEELKSRLGSPDVIVIDVRQKGDWESSNKKITSAVREDPYAIPDHVKKYPKNKSLVFYCN
jgi:hypothetical protein